MYEHDEESVQELIQTIDVESAVFPVGTIHCEQHLIAPNHSERDDNEEYP